MLWSHPHPLLSASLTVLLPRLPQAWVREGLPNAHDSVAQFVRSLGFREYSRYLCFNFPFTHERPLLANLKHFPWRVDEGLFKAWRQGRTGHPLVDAGMRELWATGWQHNRIRVVTSSFCVKYLQLPWRWGVKYFWDTLLDADLESDVLGWQYISGSLPDGHELDRMDDPEEVGYKYDPDGEYVRRWVPELTRLPTEWIHHPWDAPPHVRMARVVCFIACNCTECAPVHRLCTALRLTVPGAAHGRCGCWMGALALVFRDPTAAFLCTCLSLSLP